MPRPRTPKAKAEVSGASQVHPGRFASRVTPQGARPIGEPYLKMTDEQKEVWAEIVADAPWLRAHHRLALRQVCALASRLDDLDMGVSAHKALSSLLSKLGLTPVDD